MIFDNFKRAPFCFQQFTWCERLNYTPTDLKFWGLAIQYWRNQKKVLDIEFLNLFLSFDQIYFTVQRFILEDACSSLCPLNPMDFESWSSEPNWKFAFRVPFAILHAEKNAKLGPYIGTFIVAVSEECFSVAPFCIFITNRHQHQSFSSPRFREHRMSSVRMIKVIRIFIDRK